MKYLLILFLFSSCAVFKPRPCTDPKNLQRFENSKFRSAYVDSCERHERIQKMLAMSRKY